MTLGIGLFLLPFLLGPIIRFMAILLSLPQSNAFFRCLLLGWILCGVDLLVHCDLRATDALPMMLCTLVWGAVATMSLVIIPQVIRENLSVLCHTRTTVTGTVVAYIGPNYEKSPQTGDVQLTGFYGLVEYQTDTQRRTKRFLLSRKPEVNITTVPVLVSMTNPDVAMLKQALPGKIITTGLMVCLFTVLLCGFGYPGLVLPAQDFWSDTGYGMCNGEDVPGHAKVAYFGALIPIGLLLI